MGDYRSFWFPFESPERPEGIEEAPLRASGSRSALKGLTLIKAGREKPAWKSRGLYRESRGNRRLRREGGRQKKEAGGEWVEPVASCRRNRALRWPLWSQRRHIRRWLQWDAAGGGVRREEERGWLTLGGRAVHSNGWTHTYCTLQSHTHSPATAQWASLCVQLSVYIYHQTALLRFIPPACIFTGSN